MLLPERFADDSTDEVKQMHEIALDCRPGIRKVSRTVVCLDKQREVFIEHLFAQEHEPFFRKATLIDAILVNELDFELAFPLFGLELVQVRKGVVEGAVSVHRDPDYSLSVFSMLLFELDAPDQTLGVEVEDLRQTKHQVFELGVDELLVDSYELVQKFLVLDKERRHRLKLSVLRRSLTNVGCQ